MAIVPPPKLESAEPLRIRPRRRPLHGWVRVALVGIGIGLIGVFWVALYLDPYQGGKVWLAETHRQLGLPPCTFKDLTGYPCPSCGMTSSFALAIRGDLWNSAQANFVGTLLAVGCLAFIPWSLVSARSGRLLGIANLESVLVRGVIGFLILMLGRWGVVVALMHLHS